MAQRELEGRVAIVTGSAKRIGRAIALGLAEEGAAIVVNGRVIARGEVVVVEEDSARFGVSLTEIVGSSVDERGL